MKRLTGHFFRALFDFGILSTAGADSLTRMLLGAGGGLLAVGFGLTRIYAAKYGMLQGAASSEPYRHAVLGDDLFMIGLPMLLVAFVTVLVSPSLFPDERDFRILGPLPVPKAVVFGAKLLALLLFTGAFTAVMHVSLVPLKLLTSFSRFAEHTPPSRLAAWAVASGAASIFAVLAVTAVVGASRLALAGVRWHALAAAISSVMLGVLVVCTPLVFHLSSLGASIAGGGAWLALAPPVWFLGLERVLLGGANPWFVHLEGVALAAVGTAVAVVAVVYALLFRHVERFVLRPAARSSHATRAIRTSASSSEAPAFLGVHRFITVTIGRSQLHQGVLFGLSACGAGIAMNRLMSDGLAAAAVGVPFALMFACGLGVRATLALPMDHRANWIFRITEGSGTRGDQLRAVDWAVTSYVVGLPVAVGLPLLWLALGRTAIVAASMVVLVGLVFVRVVLYDWRRIPFTCSYLPGKRFVAHSVVFGLAAFQLFTFAAVGLVHAATDTRRAGLLMAASLLLVVYFLRRRKQGVWRETPLMFEDELPDELLQLKL